MSSTFLACLALTLWRETGYRQPVGGPYVRAKDGAVQIEPGKLRALTGQIRALPARADGMAYDDDPDDTGGRTGMGILQREFHAWCRARGKPTRDVWTIADNELEAIYAEQYWTPIRGDELPVGVRFQVFDAAVNCGVGKGVRFLQAALGIAIDGHLGAVTMDAARKAFESDPVALVEALRRARAAYHRQCKTFWKHGTNWLARTDWVAKQALAMIVAGDKLEQIRPARPSPVARGAATTPPPISSPESLLAAYPAPDSDGAGDDPTDISSPGKAKLPEKTPGNSLTIVASILAAIQALLVTVGSAVQSPVFWLGIGMVGLAFVIGGERLRKFAREALGA